MVVVSIQQYPVFLYTFLFTSSCQKSLYKPFCQLLLFVSIFFFFFYWLFGTGVCSCSGLYIHFRSIQINAAPVLSPTMTPDSPCQRFLWLTTRGLLGTAVWLTHEYLTTDPVSVRWNVKWARLNIRTISYLILHVFFQVFLDIFPAESLLDAGTLSLFVQAERW